MVRDAVAAAVPQAPAGQAAALAMVAVRALTHAPSGATSDDDATQPPDCSSAAFVGEHSGVDLSWRPSTSCRIASVLLCAIRVEAAHAHAVAAALGDLATVLRDAWAQPTLTSSCHRAASRPGRESALGWCVPLLEVHAAAAGLQARCAASHPGLDRPFEAVLGAIKPHAVFLAPVPSQAQLAHLLHAVASGKLHAQAASDRDLAAHCSFAPDGVALSAGAIMVPTPAADALHAPASAVAAYLLQRIVQLHDELATATHTCPRVTVVGAAHANVRTESVGATEAAPEAILEPLQSMSLLLGAFVTRGVNAACLAGTPSAMDDAVLSEALRQLPLWAQHLAGPALQHVLHALLRCAACTDAAVGGVCAVSRAALQDAALWYCVPRAAEVWRRAVGQALAQSLAAVAAAVQLHADLNADAIASGSSKQMLISAELLAAVRSGDATLTPELANAAHHVLSEASQVLPAALLRAAGAVPEGKDISTLVATLQELCRIVELAALHPTAYNRDCMPKHAQAPAAVILLAGAALAGFLHALAACGSADEGAAVLRACVRALAACAPASGPLLCCRGALRALCGISTVEATWAACSKREHHDITDAALFSAVHALITQLGAEADVTAAKDLAAEVDAMLPAVTACEQACSQLAAAARPGAVVLARVTPLPAAHARTDVTSAMSAAAAAGQHEQLVALHALAAGTMCESGRAASSTPTPDGELRRLLRLALNRALPAITRARVAASDALASSLQSGLHAEPMTPLAQGALARASAAAGSLFAIEACCAGMEMRDPGPEHVAAAADLLQVRAARPGAGVCCAARAGVRCAAVL